MARSRNYFVGKEHKPKACWQRQKMYPRPRVSSSKPGGQQGVSADALQKMCEENKDGTKRLSLSHWKPSKLEGALSPSRSEEQNFREGTKRCLLMAINKTANLKKKVSKRDSKTTTTPPLAPLLPWLQQHRLRKETEVRPNMHNRAMQCIASFSWRGVLSP